ncbi:MAG: ribonuclease E/G [Pseudomonadota bacterium]
MSDSGKFWIYESGIGENRAMLVDQGRCRKIRIERPGESVRFGDVVDAKLVEQWVPGKSGIAELATGEQCLLDPLPDGLTEGAAVRIRIARAAIREPGGQAKRAVARPEESDVPLARGPDLLGLTGADNIEIRKMGGHGPDILADFGWYDAVEQAETGRIEFDGGTLLVALTPAMTVIDVDGILPAMELAKRAAKEVALLLPRLDITGSVVIDFPTLDTKAGRADAVAVFDEHMAEDCERTAINGFGLMQIISRKTGPSVPEMLQSDRVKTTALQLLRQAERGAGSGSLVLEVHPAVAAWLQKEDPWLEQLAKRTGRPVEICPRGELAIQAGVVASS